MAGKSKAVPLTHSIRNHQPLISTFKNPKFQAKEYVQEFSRQLAVSVEADSSVSGFDVAPFFALFNQTQDDLTALREGLALRTEHVLEEVTEAERKHVSDMAALNLAFDQVNGDFQNLDRRINVVGSTAVRIGDRLEQVDTQRARAIEAHTVIAAFSELNSRGSAVSSARTSHSDAGSSSSNGSSSNRLVPSDSVRRGTVNVEPLASSAAGAAAAAAAAGIPAAVIPVPPLNELRFDDAAHAQLIKKLMHVARECGDVRRVRRAKEAAEALSSKLESELLDTFAVFVLQKDSEDKFAQMRKIAQILSDFNGGDRCIGRYISTLPMFFDTTSLEEDRRMLIHNQNERLDPATRPIQRGQQQRTQTADSDPRITEFYSGIKSVLSHERLVARKVFPNPDPVLHQLIHRIFEERIRNFLDSILQPPTTPETLLPYLCSFATAFTKTKELAAHLSEFQLHLDISHLVESLFCQYKEAYIRQEIESLQLIYASELQSLQAKLDDIGTEVTNSEDASAMQTLLNSEVTLSSLDANTKAAERCALLSPEADMPYNMYLILNMLLKYLGHEFVGGSLRDAVRRISITPVGPTAPKDSVADATRHFFEQTRSVTQTALLLQSHFASVVMPRMKNAVNLQTKCVQELTDVFSLLESQLSLGLEHCLDKVVRNVERVLAEQKKTDFRPKESDDLDPNPSPACVAAVEAIRVTHSAVMCCLDGKNIARFLEELGLRYARVLRQHLKKFAVTKGIGGLKLMRDLTEYKLSVSKWAVPSVEEEFELLRELANLYLVAPENLKGLIDDSRLARLPPPELVAFLRLRSDFSRGWISKYQLADESLLAADSRWALQLLDFGQGLPQVSVTMATGSTSDTGEGGASGASGEGFGSRGSGVSASPHLSSSPNTSSVHLPAMAAAASAAMALLNSPSPSVPSPASAGAAASTQVASQPAQPQPQPQPLDARMSLGERFNVLGRNMRAMGSQSAGSARTSDSFR